MRCAVVIAKVHGGGGEPVPRSRVPAALERMHDRIRLEQDVAAVVLEAVAAELQPSHVKDACVASVGSIHHTGGAQTAESVLLDQVVVLSGMGNGHPDGTRIHAGEQIV